MNLNSRFEIEIQIVKERFILRRAGGLAALALLLSASAASGEEIRIEVSRGHPAAHVAGADATASEGTEAAPLPLARAKVHTLAAQGETLALDGHQVRPPLVLKPGGAPLVLDGKQLPGRLEVWAEKGGLVVVNALDLEEYVAAVVSSEMPSSWPPAALEAQAVAARTYAVAQKIASGPGARAHLGASVLDQVYAGAAHPQSGARDAARATYGQVLTWNAAPIAAYFSAACGGKGESAEAAFELPKGSAPYLPSADDGDSDAAKPNLAWAVRIPLAQLSNKLRKAGRIKGELVDLSISQTTPSGRARELKLLVKGGSAITLRASELRQLAGYTQLPSLAFTVEVEHGAALFRGRGSGHGVGLCQWGARGRALAGGSYRKILEHYYPGAEIRQMY
jgi:stage II sporulation protein D